LNGFNNLTFIEGKIEVHYTNITNLSGLDNVDSIKGDLILSNNPLSSLINLEDLTFIGGELWIGNCDSLSNLIGLDNVTSLGGLYLGSNNTLTNLSGLDNVTTICGDLKIEYSQLTDITSLINVTSIAGIIYFKHNNVLTNLDGLDNITSFNGVLFIWFNNSLTSLMALNNIEDGYISYFNITNNPSLTTCEIQSICYFISNPTGPTDLSDNAQGCNSQEEVEEACEVSVREMIYTKSIKPLPNPFTTSTTIEYQLDHPSEIIIHIYNHLGVLVDLIQKKQSQGKQQMVWDAEGLPAGIYYFRLQAGEQVSSGKVLLMR